MKLNLGYLRISSPAFGPLERIPKSYAYDGDNLSPPLEWSNAPADTQEFALICFDPDAPLMGLHIGSYMAYLQALPILGKAKESKLLWKVPLTMGNEVTVARLHLRETAHITITSGCMLLIRP